MLLLLLSVAGIHASSASCLGVKDYFCGRNAESETHFCLHAELKQCAAGTVCSNAFHQVNLLESPCIVGAPNPTEPSAPSSAPSQKPEAITDRIVVNKVPGSLPAHEKTDDDTGSSPTSHNDYTKAAIGIGIFLGAIVVALVIIQQTAVKRKRPLTLLDSEQRELECPYEEVQDVSTDLLTRDIAQHI